MCSEVVDLEAVLDPVLVLQIIVVAAVKKNMSHAVITETVKSAAEAVGICLLLDWFVGEVNSSINLFTMNFRQ